MSSHRCPTCGAGAVTVHRADGSSQTACVDGCVIDYPPRSSNVRPATPDERERYVASTWAASWVRSRRSGKAAAQRTISELLRAQPVLVVPMTGTEGRAEDVAGWICYTPLRSTAVIHYVYVREPRRREGIARELVQAAGVDLRRLVPSTCYTSAGQDAATGAGVRLSPMSYREVIA